MTEDVLLALTLLALETEFAVAASIDCGEEDGVSPWPPFFSSGLDAFFEIEPLPPFGVPSYTPINDLSFLVCPISNQATYGPKRHRRWPTDPHKYRHRR